MLVVRISVRAANRRHAPMPTMVLPAPQGSTMTPLPPLARRRRRTRRPPPLVVAQREGWTAVVDVAQLDRQRRALGVAGQVLGRDSRRRSAPA